MRINLITNNTTNTGLSQDVQILRGILVSVFGKDISIRKINYVFPECAEAEVNIFLEVINPALFSFARKNIWIVNIEWMYKSWKPYLHMVDEIWTKTPEATEALRSKDLATPIYTIPWTSIAKTWNTKKNYSKAIVPVGKNIYRNPKPILQAYYRVQQEEPELFKKFPHLYIPYDPKVMTITYPEDIQSKVTLIPNLLSDKEYDELVSDCGLCICVSVAEGYCHAVNECMSAGCNLILSPISAFQQVLATGTLAQYADELDKQAQPDCMGTLIDSDVGSIIWALNQYSRTSLNAKKEQSEKIRLDYERRHSYFLNAMKVLLLTSLNIEDYSMDNELPKEDTLPDVSIVCITKDRRIFMPLLKYSYMIQSYPEDKLELVIVDDGEDSIEDTLIGVPNVNYVRCSPGKTISEKRNLGVEKALYDIVCFMDDDDVYPNNSVLHRAAMLLKSPVKECAFCTTIPCYDICQYSSFMNVPPWTLPMSQRVSEASMIFTKKFWSERKFDETIHVGEADAFIRGREHMCRELSPQEVIVSLVHKTMTSSRRCPPMKEPNGCHFGFNEKLFALVSSIGETINSGGRTESDASCGDGDGDRQPLQEPQEGP